MPSTPSLPHLGNYSGKRMLDARTEVIGKITDVLYDGTDLQPSWLIVGTGLLRSEHYVPADGAYETQAGDVVVAFDKRWIKSSPKADRRHVLASDDREQLVAHYRTVSW
jgi:hypothetical protein